MLLLVVMTYIVSVSVTEARAASIVLTVQLATVWLTLRVSRARRMVRLVADIVLCLAAVVAVVSFFAHQPGDQLGGVFAVCCLLYLIAPFPSCAIWCCDGRSTARRCSGLSLRIC